MKKLMLLLTLASFVLIGWTSAENRENLTRSEAMKMIVDSLDLGFDIGDIECAEAAEQEDLKKGTPEMFTVCMHLDYEYGDFWRVDDPITNEEILRLVAQVYFIGLRASSTYEDYYLKILHNEGIPDVYDLNLAKHATPDFLQKVLNVLKFPEAFHLAELETREGLHIEPFTVQRIEEREKRSRTAGDQEKVIIRDFDLMFAEPLILQGYYVDDGYGVLSGAYFYPTGPGWKIPLIENEEGGFMWGRGLNLYSHGSEPEAFPLAARGEAVVKLSGVSYKTGRHPMRAHLRALDYEVLDYQVQYDPVPHGARPAMRRWEEAEGNFFPCTKEGFAEKEWWSDLEDQMIAPLSLKEGCLSTDESFFIFINTEGECSNVYSYNVFTDKIKRPENPSLFCASNFGEEKGKYGIGIFDGDREGEFFYSENRIDSDLGKEKAAEANPEEAFRESDLEKNAPKWKELLLKLWANIRRIF